MRNFKTILFLFIIVILLIGNIFFAARYFNVRTELRQTKAGLKARTTNKKVLDFTKLFIEKVLKAEGEIDFETRLKLESGVRDLNDEKILSEWQKFVDSQTEADAQENVKDLLEALAWKI